MVKFSIITVTYNSAATIAHTIESIQEQKFVDIEHIIIDGGSTDTTLEIINKLSEKGAKVLSERDDGIYDAMNKGVKLATGDVVGILNSDDFYVDDQALFRVAENFSDGIDIVFGAVEFVDPKQLRRTVRKVGLKNFKPFYLRFGWMPPHTATFIRKHVVKEVGFYKTSYISAADYEYFVRVFLKGRYRYRSIRDTLVMMRTGGISTNGIRSYIRTTIEMKKSLLDNGYFASLVILSARLPLKFVQEKILAKKTTR